MDQDSYCEDFLRVPTTCRDKEDSGYSVNALGWGEKPRWVLEGRNSVRHPMIVPLSLYKATKLGSKIDSDTIRCATEEAVV